MNKIVIKIANKILRCIMSSWAKKEFIRQLKERRQTGKQTRNKTVNE